MKTLFIPFIACILISINLTAQDKSGKEVRGDRYTFNYDYEKAIKNYNKTDNLTVDGQRALAESYHKLDQNRLAEETYANMIGADIDIDRKSVV